MGSFQQWIIFHAKIVPGSPVVPTKTQTDSPGSMLEMLKLTFEHACKGRFKSQAGHEAGVAEDYDLVADAGLWLDGMQSICVVILAKYYESPPYRMPFGT